MVKKEQQHLFNLRRLKKFSSAPNFYRCTIESIVSCCITAWYGNRTVHKRRRHVRWCGQPNASPGGTLPALQDNYSPRCHRKAKDIIKDLSHPIQDLFTQISSRWRGQYRCIKAGTNIQKNSFYLQAIRLLNSSGQVTSFPPVPCPEP